MRIAVCGLGCKSTFEITEDNEEGAICHVLTLDLKEDKGYREVMTFGCDLCQKTAQERKDILETSAVAVTVGMERDRYKGELATAKAAHEATLENYRMAVGHLETAENDLTAEKEAHAITRGQLLAAEGALESK